VREKREKKSGGRPEETGNTLEKDKNRFISSKAPPRAVKPRSAKLDPRRLKKKEGKGKQTAGFRKKTMAKVQEKETKKSRKKSEYYYGRKVSSQEALLWTDNREDKRGA